MARDIIIHIYYGSAGNVGLYLKQIVDNMDTVSADVLSYANYYIPFNESTYNKKFFKYSEKMKPGLTRKCIKYIELYYNHYKVYNEIKKISELYNRVFIVYSLNENYKPNYTFIKFIKKIERICVGITVHDIEPFYNNYSNLIMKKQDDILNLADFFIVHNEYSINELRKRYTEKSNRIFMHRFPLMDLSMISKQERVDTRKDINSINFLFIGYLRKEKGVTTLLESWRRIQNEFENAKLTIAGRIPHELDYDFGDLKNFSLIDNFLSDDDYIKFIDSCHYVILPYLKGTNSGILSTVSSLGKPAIVSNLEMFIESEFVNEELIFTKDDSDELYNLLSKLIINHTSDYNHLCNLLKNSIEKYNRKFREEVGDAYFNVLNINDEE